MKKTTLSLLVLLSLKSGAVFAEPEVSNEWLNEQAAVAAQGGDCLNNIATAMGGLAALPMAGDYFKEKTIAYTEAYKQQFSNVIGNLDKGKSNADTYQKFAQAVKYYHDQWYGKPIADCVAPHVDFQGYAKKEADAKKAGDVKAATFYHNKQRSIAVQAYNKTKEIRKAVE